MNAWMGSESLYCGIILIYKIYLMKTTILCILVPDNKHCLKSTSTHEWKVIQIILRLHLINWNKKKKKGTIQMY